MQQRKGRGPIALGYHAMYQLQACRMQCLIIISEALAAPVTPWHPPPSPGAHMPHPPCIVRGCAEPQPEGACVGPLQGLKLGGQAAGSTCCTGRQVPTHTGHLCVAVGVATLAEPGLTVTGCQRCVVQGLRPGWLV